MIEQGIILLGADGAQATQAPDLLMEISPGRVFLDYTLTHMACQGVKRAVLLTGSSGQQIEARYQGATLWGMAISVMRAPEMAGSGGALLHARDVLAPEFFLTRGESLFMCRYPVLAEMLAAGDVGALALRRNDGASLSPAATLENGRVRAFRDQGPSRAGPFPISGGVYALRRSILDHIVATSCAIEADVFPALAEAQLLAGAELDGYFLDICLSDALEQAQRELPQQFIGLL